MPWTSLRITADFSHFVVACERVLDVGEEDKELLRTIIPRVGHMRDSCLGIILE
jgi:hypothetical protein